MCSLIQLEQIKRDIVDEYRRIYGDAIVRIVLYGSYARGEETTESDVDITAIVRGERMELQKKLPSLWDASAQIGLENDAVVSPTVIPYDEFEKYKESLPYYMNIEKEGLAIG